MKLKDVKIRTALLVILLTFSAVLILTSINAWLAARDAHRALAELDRVTREQTVPVTNTLITVLRARLAVIGAEAEYQNGNLADARHSHEASVRFAREATELFQPFLAAHKSASIQPVARQMEHRFSQFQQAVERLNQALDARDRGPFWRPTCRRVRPAKVTMQPF